MVIVFNFSSSLLGLFMEMGPCRVQNGGESTKVNQYSWNNRANMIFLDQPANVGFSYGGRGVSNSDKAAEDVYSFLQLFLDNYSQYAELDFVISGEDYAGHYIPAVAYYIQDKNKEADEELFHINLKSITIGIVLY